MCQVQHYHTNMAVFMSVVSVCICVTVCVCVCVRARVCLFEVKSEEQSNQLQHHSIRNAPDRIINSYL